MYFLESVHTPALCQITFWLLVHRLKAVKQPVEAPILPKTWSGRGFICVPRLVCSLTLIVIIHTSPPTVCCSDDIFLLANLVISNALFPSTKSLWDFSVGFWITAENKLCGKQRFIILTCFVQQYKINTALLILQMKM